MKQLMKIFVVASLWTVVFSSAGLAAPDQYLGDSAIYGGGVAVQPNVLIILDNSGSMDDNIPAGAPYSGGTVYTQTDGCGGQPCVTNTVYKCTAWGLECGNWTATVADVNNVTTSCGGSNPKDSLLTTGQWNSSRRRLKTDGSCGSGSGIYATGNWVNWRQQAGTPRPKMEVAKEVVTNLINSTSGIKFGVMVFNNNQGGRLLAYNGYTAGVKNMDAIFSGTTTNRQALITAVNSVTAETWTPLGETLFEAMRYYKGEASAFNQTVTYTSPIEAACQKNYVVVVTDGMSTQDRDNVLQTICANGDCDGDGFEPAGDPAKNYENQGSDYLDDVAKYLYDNDMTTAYAGTQNVVTYTVGFGLGGANAGAVKLLQEAAANGHGQALMSNNQQELADSLTNILGQIFEVNSSFVAPVVPVSPENRTYSGSRVYLGFFKPESSGTWHGNLKKYGVNSSHQVVDVNGDIATNSDGSFKGTAVSFWSSDADGGDVDSGGAGEALRNRSGARSIYTYTGSNADLSHSSNAFTTSNAAITATTLGVSMSTDKDKLINFIHGIDSYDDDGNGNSTEKREWIMGDILHSKPLVVSYAPYAFNETSEGDCNINKSMIYVGANDGMLHAFRDCDGSEAWAFVPQDLLPNLRYQREGTHTYFVDSSPVSYIYDANRDGTIDASAGDKVVIIFGERRGGGKNVSPTTGFYYALDVSDPAAPRYLWRLSNTESPSGTSTDYSELAETWSEPKITRVKTGGSSRIVAFIGAGYDNLNEDGRYGATQTFSGTGLVDTLDTGSGVVTSTGTAGPANPKGRGIYVIEVAVLDGSGVPSFTNSGYKVWGYTHANNSAMTFSFPVDLSALDTDYNGYTDRIYAGDAGGNIWRFDVGDASTTNWAARRIFSANSGSGDVGRKIFYKPSVTIEPGYMLLFLGTGDREHPLNRAVVDRLYSVKDANQAGAKAESDMVDVTTDLLQTSPDSGTISGILASLNTAFGWYIQLNENSGEKVLAPALALSKVAYYTTYAPSTTGSADPCNQGNLGTGRLYAVDYKTGESVLNYDGGNDGETTGNARATGTAGEVHVRSDRVRTVGSGIPSGVVAMIGAGGNSSLVLGIGGGLLAPESKQGGMIIPLYWRQK